MYFVAVAARFSEYLKPDVLNCTRPPVSVSQSWPLVTRRTRWMPLLLWRLTSL